MGKEKKVLLMFQEAAMAGYEVLQCIMCASVLRVFIYMKVADQIFFSFDRGELSK